MRARPTQWTPHHTRRIFHISVMATFVFACFMVIYGIFLVLSQVNALTLTGQQDASVTATVPGIEPEPAVIQTSSGGGSGGLAVNVPSPTPTPALTSISMPVPGIPATANPSSKPNNPSSSGSSGTVLFDVVVKIPGQFKVINPGDDLVASIQLINFGAAGNPVDVNVEYLIVNSQGKTVLDSSETVAVATTESIVKTFHTNPNMPQGLYTLIVRVPSKGVVAVSQDTFSFNGTPVVSLTNDSKINFTIFLQALLALLFLFALVVYFEYNKVSVLSNIIKKVDETDLVKVN